MILLLILQTYIYIYISCCIARDGSLGAPRKTAYLSVSIQTNKVNGSNFRIYIIGSILVFVLLLMTYAAYQMYQKTKKLSKRLQYEMQDVRNIANVGFASGDTTSTNSTTSNSTTPKDSLLSDDYTAESSLYNSISDI